MRILAICGSLQGKSGNLTLLRTAQAVAATLEGSVEVVLSDALRHLPPFDPDVEAEGEAPAAVTALRAEIAASDALLIASPEYGHSLPGSLKNAIDWLIGSGELEKKIVGVTASTNHAERGALGLSALLGTLAAVSARVVGGKPIVKGATFEDEVKKLLEGIRREVRAGDPSLRSG